MVEQALRCGYYQPLELYATQEADTSALLKYAQSQSLAIRRTTPAHLRKIDSRARQALLVCTAIPRSHTLRHIIAQESTHKYSLIVLCDGITDVHNIGAIIRSAHHFSVGALVLASRHSPRDQALLAQSSTGSSFYVPLLTHQNIANSLMLLRTHNYWIVGADMTGESLYDFKLAHSHIALVVGDEQQGLRRLTRTYCDHLIAIPGAPTVDSLNVSVATAIFLYELSRGRMRTTS